MKHETPYSRLLKAVRVWRSKVINPHHIRMWCYPKAKLSDGWGLKDLYERTVAAHQLGYDVMLKANDDGLVVVYSKRPDDIDYFIG